MRRFLKKYKKGAHSCAPFKILDFQFLSETEGPDYCGNDFFSETFGKKAFVHMKLGSIAFTKLLDIFHKIRFVVNDYKFAVFLKNAVRNALNGDFVLVGSRRVVLKCSLYSREYEEHTACVWYCSSHLPQNSPYTDTDCGIRAGSLSQPLRVESQYSCRCCNRG